MHRLTPCTVPTLRHVVRLSRSARGNPARLLPFVAGTSAASMELAVVLRKASAASSETVTLGAPIRHRQGGQNRYGNGIAPSEKLIPADGIDMPPRRRYVCAGGQLCV